MNAVLRIALSFFSIVPLQMVMNVAGIALLAFALVNGGNDGVLYLGMAAALLLTGVPVFSGGIALRYACGPSLLNVRPIGRARLFLGATLAITLIAALWALPLQVHAWSREMGSVDRPDIPSAFFLFQMAWSVTAVAWVAIFAASRSQAAYAMVGVAPVLVFIVGRHLSFRVDSFDWILPTALGLWIGFGAWLMRAREVARPAVSPHGGTSETHPFSWIIDILPTSARATTGNAVTLHMMGGGLTMFVVNGLWIALIFIAVRYMTDRSGPGPNSGGSGTLFMLPFLAIMCTPVGYSMARRARLLWLRTGLNRAALFHQAEQKGLLAMGITWCIPAATILAGAAATGQHPAMPLVVAYVLPASLLAALLFYGGLAMTRGFGPNALLVVVLFILYSGIVALVHPTAQIRTSHSLAAAGLTIVAIVLLRAFGLRSWRSLDWRIAKMPPPSRRRT